MTIEIQKNVPIPVPIRGPRRSGEFRTTLSSLDVGDSFLAGDKKFLTQLGPRALGLRPKKFCARTCNEGGVDVVRIWRIA